MANTPLGYWSGFSLRAIAANEYTVEYKWGLSGVALWQETASIFFTCLFKRMPLKREHQHSERCWRDEGQTSWRQADLKRGYCCTLILITHLFFGHLADEITSFKTLIIRVCYSSLSEMSSFVVWMGVFLFVCFSVCFMKLHDKLLRQRFDC